MNTLRSNLLIELECPVCFRYFEPPILMCKNGHSICNCCIKQVKECPTCRNKFIKNRSLALENIVRGMHYPCHNIEDGCNEVLSHALILEHEQVCAKGIHECPLKNKFKGLYKCSWVGTWDKLKNHIKDGHGIPLLLKREKPSASKDTVGITFSLGEAFLDNIRREKDKWYFAAMVIGTRNKAFGFKVTYTFHNRKDSKDLKKYQSIGSYTESFEDLIKSSKCLCLRDNELKQFKTDGKINLTITYSKL